MIRRRESRFSRVPRHIGVKIQSKELCYFLFVCTCVNFCEYACVCAHVFVTRCMCVCQSLALRGVSP